MAPRVCGGAIRHVQRVEVVTMSVTDPEVAFIRITDETSADELREALRHLTDDAERTSRKGAAFTRDSAEYARVHARINAVLGELEARA